MKRLLLALLFASTIARPQRANAQTEPNDAQAVELFDRGVKQREAGGCDDTPVRDADRCREAVESFRRAYELSPQSLGALRNLAYVEKGLGMTATAARHFRDLARKAPLDPRPERRLWAAFATKEAVALDAVVPHLAIQVRASAAEVTVTLDGVPLLEAAWGTALAVDPGEHVVRAERAGHAPFASTVAITNAQQRMIIVEWIAATPAPAKPGEGALGPPTVEPPPLSPTRPFPTGPVVTAGGGLVVAGFGLALGAIAKGKRDECDAQTKVCAPGTISSARDFATASTIVTSVGAGGVVAGVVWFLLRPAPPRRDARWLLVPIVQQSAAKLTVEGRF